MSRSYTVAAVLTENSAELLLDVIEDELEYGDLDHNDRGSLLAAKKAINKGLRKLDARLSNMEGLDD